MAIAVLLLWVLTAGAGLRLLFTSGLGRQRPKVSAERAVPATVPATASATAVSAAGAEPTAPASASKREARRAARERMDPPALVRSRQQSMGGLRDLVEFAHPAFGITGLAFWLGYTLVHSRVFAWIAFGIAAVTVCAGLAWFTANLRAARQRGDAASGPVFSARLIMVHGGGATLTFVLAALTALTARG
jgi:hypothetical protein